MSFLTIILIIFLISFLLALFSLREMDFNKKVFEMVRRKKIKGSIIFSKNKIIHYSKFSSSSVSSKEG